jgi:FkbM family methyltransferase
MTLASMLFALLPRHNRLLYRISKRYVDIYNGDNNTDRSRNGELRLMRERLPACRTVFDVGSNVGDWAALALEINPSLELHCFEPSAEAFLALTRRQFPPNVHINQAALGQREQMMQLYISSASSEMNSLYARRGVMDAGLDAGRSEPVQVRTGDDYCATHNIRGIDFLKIDVEGHELAVLTGMSRLLSERRIGMIQFEYGGCNIDSGVFLREIWEFLEPYGYKFHKLLPDRLRRFEAYTQAVENFQYQNWAAILDS